NNTFIRSFLPPLKITSRFTLYYPFLILLNKLLSCSAFIVSETVCSDVLVFSAITRYVIINSFSLLIFSIMNIATLIFWFPIISRLSIMLPSHILWKLASRSSIFVTCIVSFSPVLASINSFDHRNFTFFLVVLGFLYLFFIYFYSSYSVMKISYQMVCQKL